MGLFGINVFTSLIYIILYHALLVTSNILMIEYIYPFISNGIHRYINFVNDVIDSYCNTSYNNNSIYGNIYGEHYKNKDLITLPYDINSHILSSLTCPICYNLFDKIYVCPNGHSLCHKCYTSSNTCSYCRVEINKNTRNRTLEDMVENIQLPCSYYKYGCQKSILNSQRTLHENKCPYKPLKCKIDHCGYQSNYNDMKTHILRDHSNINVIKNQSELNYKFNIQFNINNNIIFNKDSTIVLHNPYYVLDTGKLLVFVKYYINDYLSFSLLSEKRNNFSIDIYNKNDKKFGKYTMLNKLNSTVNNSNTISIELPRIYNSKNNVFDIDITIYKNNKIKLN